MEKTILNIPIYYKTDAEALYRFATLRVKSLNESIEKNEAIGRNYVANNYRAIRALWQTILQTPEAYINQ